MGVVLDTSFLIDVLRNRRNAVAFAEALDDAGEVAHIPAPALYELRAGLLHHTARAQAARFTAMLLTFPILPLDAAAAEKAAEIQSDGLRNGKAKDDIDTLIAGITLATGHELVTRDGDYDDMAEAFGIRLRRY